MNNYQIVTYGVVHIRGLNTTPKGLRKFLKRKIKAQDNDVFVEVWKDDPSRNKGGQILALFVDGEHRDATIIQEVEEYE